VHRLGGNARLPRDSDAGPPASDAIGSLGTTTYDFTWSPDDWTGPDDEVVMVIVGALDRAGPHRPSHDAVMAPAYLDVARGAAADARCGHRR
jgi:hypothetical protein